MPLAWSKLAEIRDYVPVADLGVSLDLPVSALPLIGESPVSMAGFRLKNWFKTGPHQYLHVVCDELRRFAWAASDGAFAYIQAGDVFFDDGATCSPPPDVLPDGKPFDWSSRVQDFGRHSFYYRHTAPTRGEAPICIIISPKIWPPIEGQQRAFT